MREFEKDPVKRVMLQHDLWAVFDWAATCYADDGEKKNLAKMHNRPGHTPTVESNEVIYRWFEWALK